MSTLRQFGKESLVYGIGYISIRAVSFLLLPLFTNILSKEEYGIYALIFTFIAFSQVFYNYGLDSALMKYYVKNSEDKQTVCTTIIASITLTTILFSGLFWIFALPISDFFLGTTQPLFIKIAALILFFDAYSFRTIIIIRSNNQSYRYLFITMTNVIITFCANLVLVAKFQMGVTGALYGTLLASMFTFLLTTPTIIQYINFSKFSTKKLKMLLQFALPIFPAIIFKIIMEMSDRYILLWMTNVETVAVYSAGYKIGSLMLFLINGFQLGWDPFFLKNENNRDAPQMFSRITLYFSTFLLIIWLFFVLFIDKLIQIRIFNINMIGEEFWSSSQIIPIVMLGYIFLGFYHLLMPGIFYSNKTKLLPVFRGIGALSNIGLNILLIPKYGATGAAIATAISFGLMLISLYFRANRLFHIPYFWKSTSGLFILAMMIYITTYFVNFSISLSILVYLGYVMIGIILIRRIN